MQSQMQSERFSLLLEVEVGPFATRVNTKESCFNPLGHGPKTDNSDKYGLYVDESSL